MHFLIADHHVDSATILGLLIEAYLPCSTVEVAHDGIAALKAGIGKRPDVAILNLNLPCMNGTAVARELRSFFHSDAPVLIAVSADARLLPGISGDGPFHHFFLKPFNVEQMLSLIDP